SGDVERTLTGELLLIATGRTPNTEALDLPKAGIAKNDKGFVRVDERLQTNVPGVYAVGDVNGGPQFTHISYDDYRILEGRLLRGEDRVTTGRRLPYTVFIDPQLGHIGLHEKEARQTGRHVTVVKMPL